MEVKQTLVEKIIAKHAGVAEVHPGQIVDVTVDRLLVNDMNAPTVFRSFEELGVSEVACPDRVLVGIDHQVPPVDVKAANNLVRDREFCNKYKLPLFTEIGRHGVGHQVMVENFTRPDEIAVGTDSHATTYGGLGCLGAGCNSSDAAVIMATGKMWMKVPETILVELKGRPRKGVSCKDIALAVNTLGSLVDFNYKMVEFRGDYAHEMSVSSRLTICNETCETGAKGGIFPADQIVANYVGDTKAFYMDSDPDAEYCARYVIDLETLEPSLACPHEVNNVHPVHEVKGKKINQAFLGSCTNGRIQDFEEAAEILRGRKIHPDVRLLVVPASQKIYRHLINSGLAEVFMEAGAALLGPSCASCGGQGEGCIGYGEVCISTTNRNWKGRMGDPTSEVYLASPYIVAASAIEGVITDPRKYL